MRSPFGLGSASGQLPATATGTLLAPPCCCACEAHGGAGTAVTDTNTYSAPCNCTGWGQPQPSRLTPASPPSVPSDGESWQGTGRPAASWGAEQVCRVPPGRYTAHGRGDGGCGISDARDLLGALRLPQEAGARQQRGRSGASPADATAAYWVGDVEAFSGAQSPGAASGCSRRRPSHSLRPPTRPPTYSACR